MYFYILVSEFGCFHQIPINFCQDVYSIVALKILTSDHLSRHLLESVEKQCLIQPTITSPGHAKYYSYRIHLVSFDARLCPTWKNVLDCVVWVNYPGEASALEEW